MNMVCRTVPSKYLGPSMLVEYLIRYLLITTSFCILSMCLIIPIVALISKLYTYLPT